MSAAFGDDLTVTVLFVIVVLTLLALGAFLCDWLHYRQRTVAPCSLCGMRRVDACWYVDCPKYPPEL